MTARMQRTTFRTSRLLDFCSRKEMIAQIGHQPADWPLVVLKELLDNACDACEDARVAPVVNIGVDEHGITVADNGPGMPSETVAGLCDFSARMSSREAYVSPTRGTQGNALQTIIAMPFVLDGERGRVEIAAQGLKHEISLRVDRIRQQPVLERQPANDPTATSGTRIRVFWPKCACKLLDDARALFLQMAAHYTFLNPHLTLRVYWGEERLCPATEAGWMKWLPSYLTCIHWYDLERFHRIVSAYIAHDHDRGQDRTVREFISSKFEGLASTAKQKAVLEATGLARTNLSQLANDNGLNEELVNRLLRAMKLQTRPIKPKALGIIGEQHLRNRFHSLGCEPESFTYKRRFGETDGIPWVQEVAFAYCGKATSRRFIAGVNWSPGVINPFRQLGRSGESLDSMLERLRAGRDEPIVLLLHIATPRVEYTDRGKSAVVVGGQALRDEEDHWLNDRGEEE